MDITGHLLISMAIFVLLYALILRFDVRPVYQQIFHNLLVQGLYNDKHVMMLPTGSKQLI